MNLKTQYLTGSLLCVVICIRFLSSNKMKSDQGKAKMRLLAVIMATIAQFPVVRPETIFTEETPLLWTESNEQWKSGTYELTLTLQLTTPCRYLQQKDIFECEKEYHERLFHPLQDLCMEPGPLQNRIQRRGKRWLKKVLDFVGTVVLGIGYNLLSSDTGKSQAALNEDRKRVSDLQSAIGLMEKEIFSLHQEITEKNANIDTLLKTHKSLSNDVERNNEADKRIFTLRNQLKKNEKDLRKMENEMMDKVNKLNQAMITLNEGITEWRKSMEDTIRNKIKEHGHFLINFVRLNAQLTEFSRSWRQGVLSDELFDILMMAPNDTVVNEYRGAKPKSCQFSTFTKLAVFHFEKSAVDSDITILESRPFRLHRQVPHTDNVEIVTYQGPRNILYLSKSQCTVPFDKDIGFVFMPSTDDCHMLEKQHTFDKFWTKSCKKETDVHGSDVQIQQMGNKLFIYCYGQDIIIYDESQPCPNYVFSIHENEKFEISKFRTGAPFQVENYDEQRSDLLTLLINHRILPNTLQMDLDDIPTAIACPTKMSVNGAIWSFIAIVLVVLAIVSYMWIVRSSRKAKARRHVVQFVNKLQLKDGMGINTFVREEVRKQLLTDSEPPSYEPQEDA